MKRPCWCPFQEHQHGGQNKTVLIWQYTISTPVDLVLLQIILKVITSIFHSIKHFYVHKFIAFCDQRDSHNYDNEQMLENLNI